MSDTFTLSAIPAPIAWKHQPAAIASDAGQELSTDVLGCQDPKMSDFLTPVTGNTKHALLCWLHSGDDQSVATGFGRVPAS